MLTTPYSRAYQTIEILPNIWLLLENPFAIKDWFIWYSNLIEILIPTNS